MGFYKSLLTQWLQVWDCSQERIGGVYSSQLWSQKRTCSGQEVTALPFRLSSREYRSRFTSEETLMFCMRVMVGVIILYDHVHPVGAFCKTSKIDVRMNDRKMCFPSKSSPTDLAKQTLLFLPSPPSPTFMH